jgi:hypothetical protein
LIWLESGDRRKDKGCYNPLLYRTLCYIPITTRAKMTHHRKIDLSMFRDDDEDDLVIAPKAKV